ncbi:hypothetical protein CLV30_113115 [Haloactinopolyspora alba]|uniref:Uncharacterized protein n=1 Tax=Haloactinopolyspora alba TaxID=648780 RepID=A0A2P8DWS8_9ACTN|nr:hypothetical protein [Haloactinopolyspora alba]PSL01627.1 hypothetical protein CLV30_113115 [Haloactinopolyspora alba]
MQLQHEHVELLLVQHVELLRLLELQLQQHQLTRLRDLTAGPGGERHPQGRG